jgi:hypothetical protein
MGLGSNAEPHFCFWLTGSPRTDRLAEADDGEESGIEW